MRKKTIQSLNLPDGWVVVRFELAVATAGCSGVGIGGCGLCARASIRCRILCYRAAGFYRAGTIECAD